MLIFEKSVPGRRAASQSPATQPLITDIPEQYFRVAKPLLPEVSELQVVRHYTQLSRKNFSIDTHFYPLGSCTMKYNPRVANRLAGLSGLIDHHPLIPAAFSQGSMQILYEMQELLKQITGMQGVSMVPMAGAQGEYVGVSMIHAYHLARGDGQRNEILVPDAAHGTNPASAVMCGFKVKELPTGKNGDINLDVLKQMLGPNTAGIMLTNPSTLGVFERQIREIADLVHQAGGLLYYDGANLNAIVGKVRPVDMGFDVMHINLHKTFTTPHGGGGPGGGPVAANAKLAEFLPIPMVAKVHDQYVWLDTRQLPKTIGKMCTFMGNFGVTLRAYVYIKMLGREGLPRVSEYAVLNANYLMKRLVAAGFRVAFSARRASHEFIVTLSKEAKQYQVDALDFAKRLLDYGVHAPTIYFPLLIPECMLIEPTETESKQELDHFVEVMQAILAEAKNQPDIVRKAPHTMPIRRVNEVKAVRDLDLIYSER